MDTHPIHVLVVDDVPDATDTWVELLALWGYDAVGCYDGVGALVAARLRRPGAVLLDLAMPRMDGFQFAVRFRELPGCGSVPLVAVTGHTGAAHRARAGEVGIHHYLPKPADPGRLKELLARAVGSAPPAVVVPAERGAGPERGQEVVPAW